MPKLKYLVFICKKKKKNENKSKPIIMKFYRTYKTYHVFNHTSFEYSYCFSIILMAY